MYDEEGIDELGAEESVVMERKWDLPKAHALNSADNFEGDLDSSALWSSVYRLC
jgi:hypothetical protein